MEPVHTFPSSSTPLLPVKILPPEKEYLFPSTSIYGYLLLDTEEEQYSQNW